MSTDHLRKVAGYYAAHYGDRSAVGLNKSARIRSELIARWIGDGKRLLELGCGSGSLLEVYKASNRVTAMDIDRAALDACRARLGVETVWGDFTTELPFADASFDVVVAGETLEHMPHPSVFLDEIRRVLDESHIGCEINVFWDDDFKGELWRMAHDRSRLEGGWNDQISSIQIASGNWELFEHDNFAGKVLKLSPGRYPRLIDGWNDSISSFRCIEPTLAQ